MRKYILGISGLLFVAFCLIFTSWKKSNALEEKTINATTIPLKQAYLNYAKHIYASAHLADSGLAFPVFEKALTGFYNLKKSGRVSDSSLLTIADFDSRALKKGYTSLILPREISC